MAQYTNAQIASAVLNKWAQPIISQITTQLAADKIQSIPFIGNIENMAKHWGIVSPNYTIVSEIPSVIQPLSATLLLPEIHKYLSQMEDMFIPQMMHETVDKFIEQGGMTIFERVKLEVADFKELKNLLSFNLPMNAEYGGYIVKTTAEETPIV